MPNEEVEISTVETPIAETAVGETKPTIAKTPRSEVEKKLYEAIKEMSEEEAREFIAIVQKQSGSIDEAIMTALAEMGGEGEGG